MAQFKWYDIFVDLFGITLSITDPITDILTLVEFYRADHKTWFVVGLCFIILPLVFFYLLILLTSTKTITGVAGALHAYLVAVHFFALL